MATKEDMKKEILAIEPNNSIAISEAASHSDLKTELRSVKRRQEAKIKAEAIPVKVSYRLEDGEIMSWKFVDDSGDEVISTLQYGDQLPTVGSVIEVANGDDTVVIRITGHSSGLTITAADLAVREKFDPRRIYVTPNGTLVIFKRIENGRAVLWSYKTQSEIMISGRIALDRTDRQGMPVASSGRKMTQKILAAYLIAVNDRITGAELTMALREAFPNNAISSRHGPHYLSLSRNGKLPEPPEDDPREW